MIYDPGIRMPSSQYQDRWSPNPENQCSDILTGKGGREDDLLSLITSRPIKQSGLMMQRVSAGDIKAEVVCFAALCPCVWGAGFTLHIFTGTAFIALQTHVSSYGFDLFFPAVCVILLHKKEWATALTGSSECCSNNNVQSWIFTNALFRV